MPVNQQNYLHLFKDADLKILMIYIKIIDFKERKFKYKLRLIVRDKIIHLNTQCRSASRNKCQTNAINNQISKKRSCKILVNI